MPKPKLNRWDLSNQVRFVMKTRQDHVVTDCIDVVYVETILNCHDQLDQVPIVMKTR